MTMQWKVKTTEAARYLMQISRKP